MSFQLLYWKETKQTNYLRFTEEHLGVILHQWLLALRKIWVQGQPWLQWDPVKCMYAYTYRANTCVCIYTETYTQTVIHNIHTCAHKCAHASHKTHIAHKVHACTHSIHPCTQKDIYMHWGIHTCTHTQIMHTHMHSYIQTHIHTGVHAFMNVHTHAYKIHTAHIVYIHRNIHIHACMYACTCTHST